MVSEHIENLIGNLNVTYSLRKTNKNARLIVATSSSSSSSLSSSSCNNALSFKPLYLFHNFSICQSIFKLSQLLKRNKKNSLKISSAYNFSSDYKKTKKSVYINNEIVASIMCLYFVYKRKRFYRLY